MSLFAISGDGSVVTFTVTRPEVSNNMMPASFVLIWSILTQQKSKASQFQVDVYNSDHGPFLYITQYKLATHLVTISYLPN